MSRLTFQEEKKETQLVFAKGFLEAVHEALDDVKKRYFFIGFRLDEANRLKYYEPLGYSSIVELAEAEFGLGRSTAYGLMQVYNYAQGGETAMSMDWKFKDYGYTQLLEMSKAKTASRYDGHKMITVGIDKILTPKTSVSKIKEIRPKWDNYIKEYGVPSCTTLEEFEALIKAEEKPAPAPLLELAEHTEPEEQEEIRVQSIGQEEPDGEFEAELEEPANDFIEDKDYSQCEEYKNVTVRRESSDDELVEYCLTADCYSAALGIKFKIYDRYLRKEPVPFFRDFVIKSYGNFNVPDNWGEGGHFERLESKKEYGLVIERIGGGKLKIGWNTITGKIMNLITANKYLPTEELKQFLKWKAEQDGIVINTEPPAASEEPEKGISDKEYDALIKNLDALIKPKKEAQPSKKLNLKNDKVRKDWLNDFRAWGVWFEVPQVDKTFYRYDFANGAALIAEVGFGYNYWYDGTNHEYERVIYALIDEKHPKFNSHGKSCTEIIQWLTAHAKEI